MSYYNSVTEQINSASKLSSRRLDRTRDLIFFINEKVDSQVYVVEKIESILAAKSRKFTILNFSNKKLITILLVQLKRF